MGKTFVFVNQKGGVGKTTSVINLGAYFALLGQKVLLIDFDPQGNMSSGIGIDKNNLTIYDAISQKTDLKSVIHSSAIERLFVAPASIDLSGATVELVDKEGRNFYLKELIETVKDDYDYIFIDCPPSLGILTLNGLTAADAVLIPLQCEYFALEGLTLLLNTVQKVQNSTNPDLKIGGIFFTMYDPRTNLAQEVVQQVCSYFKDSVFTTIIPRNVRLSEAPSHGLPICLYDEKCTGARSYKQLAEEVLNHG